MFRGCGLWPNHVNFGILLWFVYFTIIIILFFCLILMHKYSWKYILLFDLVSRFDFNTFQRPNRLLGYAEIDLMPNLNSSILYVCMCILYVCMCIERQADLNMLSLR